MCSTQWCIGSFAIVELKKKRSRWWRKSSCRILCISYICTIGFKKFKNSKKNYKRTLSLSVWNSSKNLKLKIRKFDDNLFQTKDERTQYFNFINFINFINKITFEWQHPGEGHHMILIISIISIISTISIISSFQSFQSFQPFQSFQLYNPIMIWIMIGDYIIRIRIIISIIERKKKVNFSDKSSKLIWIVCERCVKVHLTLKFKSF